MKYTLPSKLYKYQSYNTNALDNLKNRQLWFSKPSKFNDPFDCAIHFEIAYQTDEDWNDLYKIYRKEFPEGQDFDKKYLTNNKVNQLFKDEALRGLNKAFQERIDIMRNKRGVACFSEVVDNILMWGHYADGHRGFCLEFDTSNEHFSRAFPVDYSDTFPTMHLTKVLVREEDDAKLMDMITTKAKLWSYEKEWRLFHMEGDKQYGVGIEALTGIYFGCEMPFTHKEIISLILDNASTKLYEMQKVEGKFQLEFRKVDYTPYSKREIKP
ncbi:MAG: DUF2971 domain-containing protein [Anaerolineales bacterium]|nr:DUF2971 domain-containing protein [Anaerolineales bacterium]